LRPAAESSNQRGDAAADLFDVRAAVEGADAEVAFAGAAEATARCDDHVRLMEHLVEHLPAREAVRAADPDVRGIHTAKNGEASLLASFDE